MIQGTLKKKITEEERIYSHKSYTKGVNLFSIVLRKLCACIENKLFGNFEYFYNFSAGKIQYKRSTPKFKCKYWKLYSER